MITFSPNIKDCLKLDTIEAFYMIKVIEVNGTLLYNTTSFYADIQLTKTVGNTQVELPEHFYKSDGTLISVDPPQASTNVDREQYKIVFTDPLFAKKEDIANNLIGCLIECRVGLVDRRTTAGSNLGKPFLNINDTVVAYKGRVESLGMTVKAGGLGERLIQITGSSPMRNLDMKKSTYTSKDNIRKNNPSDTCCDTIYEGATAITLKWGKT